MKHLQRLFPLALLDTIVLLAGCSGQQPSPVPPATSIPTPTPAGRDTPPKAAATRPASLDVSIWALVAGRLTLLRERNPDLGGIAIWSLRGEDPANWQSLHAALGAGQP